MRKLMLLLALPFFMACSDDDSPLGPEDIDGAYALQTIDGAALPVEVNEDGDVYEFTAGTLTLNANGSFSVQVGLRWEENGVTETDTDGTSGTYTVTGSTLNFTSTEQDSDFETGTLSGDQVTVVSGGMEFVFRK